MKKTLRSVLQKLGYNLTRYVDPTEGELRSFSDLSEENKAHIRAAKPYTMTSVARMAALISAVEYIDRHRIPGDIVECGVWRGGSMMTVALKLLALGDSSRSLYLYDTYEGMSAPTAEDTSLDGVSAAEQLAREEKGTGVWCYASLEDVRKNVISTGYPKEKVHLIKGKVEDTIPAQLPSEIALLRLDTDWYESTKHELFHLYPLLRQHGVLVIDDYGHWQGAKKAVDEYFESQTRPFYLHRIDYTGRIVIKAAG